MKYLKKFTQYSDYEEFINGGGGGEFTSPLVFQPGRKKK